MQVCKDKKKSLIQNEDGEFTWFSVLSAAMFFKYAVMCALSCSTLSVSEIIFQVTAGSGKNEIALPHENHHLCRLISINMQAQKKNKYFDTQIGIKYQTQVILR
jgi:hypothetical protein